MLSCQFLTTETSISPRPVSPFALSSAGKLEPSLLESVRNAKRTVWDDSLISTEYLHPVSGHAIM